MPGFGWKARIGENKAVSWCIAHIDNINADLIYIKSWFPLKGTSWHERSSKNQIRLRIRAVWSESSMSAFWIANALLPNDPMLNIWFIMKTNAAGGE